MSIYITGSSGSMSIPELTADPASPTAQSAWVLGTSSSGIVAGNPIGLLLALTYTAIIPDTFRFSYRTIEGTTVRTTLS